MARPAVLDCPLFNGPYVTYFENQWSCALHARLVVYVGSSPPNVVYTFVAVALRLLSEDEPLCEISR